MSPHDPRSLFARLSGYDVVAAASNRLYWRLLRQLPALYFCWAAVFGATVAWVVPPWQNPDELAQMMRIVQISMGGFFGVREDGGGGGVTDVNLITAMAPFNAIPFHAEVKATQGALRAAGGVRWGGPFPWHFANTAAYPPVLYATAVPAALIGRLGRMRVIDTLRLVRVFDAVGAALLGAAAVGIARRTRLAIGAVLVMPMSLSLAASASQDALLIPIACLAVALIDRARTAPLDAPRPWSTLPCSALCLAATITARPPYLLLVLLPLLSPTPYRGRVWLVGMLAVLAFAWMLYVRRLGYPTLQADPQAQAWRVFHHPLVFVQAVWASLSLWWKGYIASMVGTFGWLDTNLPGSFTDVVRWLIPLVLASAAVADRDRRGWPRWIALLAALGSVVAVFLSMYLIWSPLRSTVVLGIQGRYFLPLLPVLALGMPNLGCWAAWLRPPTLVGLIALGAVGPVVTIVTLIDRYYLQP